MTPPKGEAWGGVPAQARYKRFRDGALIDAPGGGVVALTKPGAMRNVGATSADATSATLSDSLPEDTGGSPITGIRRTRNDPTGTMGGSWTTVDPPNTTSRVFLGIAGPATYTLTTSAINAQGEGPPTSATVQVGQAGGGGGVSLVTVALFPYAADSVWKLGRAEAATRELTTATKTAAWLNNGVAGDGQVWVNSYDYSHDMVTASAADPLRTMVDLNDSSRTRTYRIPLDARPSGGTDAHLHVLQPDGFTVMEAFAVTITNPGTAGATYACYRVATSDLRSNGLGPQAGTRAYGGGAMAGLIRKHEVDIASPHFKADPRYPGQNVPLITHPLAWAVRDNQLYHNPLFIEYGYYGDDVALDTARHPGWPSGRSRRGFMKQSGYIWPATEQDYDSVSGFGHYTGAIPMGTYLFIPSDTPRPTVVNINALTATEKAILACYHASQDYGGYVTDRSGSISLYVEHTSGTAGGPAETFASLLRGGNSYSAAPVRTVVGLMRICTSNNSTSPNGGPSGATRRGAVAPVVSAAGKIFKADIAFTTPIPANPVLDSNNAAINAGIVSAPAGQKVANIDQFNASIFYAKATDRKFKVGDPTNPMTIRYNSFGRCTGYRSRAVYVGFPAFHMAGTRQHQFIISTAGTTAATAPNFAVATAYGQTVTDGTATWMHVGSFDYGNASGSAWGDITLNGVNVPLPKEAIPSPGTDGWIVVLDTGYSGASEKAYGLWVSDIVRDVNGDPISLAVSFGSVDDLNGDGRSTAVYFTGTNPWEDGGKISRGSGAGINVAWGDATYAELQVALEAEQRGDLVNALVPHALHFSTNVAQGPKDTPGAFQFPATATDGGLQAWQANRLYYEWEEALRPADRVRVRSLSTHTSAGSYDATKWASTGNDYAVWPIREGQRFWLDCTDADISAMATPFQRIMARTARKFGIYCSDKGGAIMSCATEYPWSTAMKATKATLGVSGYVGLDWPWTKFKALKNWDGLA